MAIGTLAAVLPQLRDASLAMLSTTSDAELLDRFVSHRDEGAFEIMLRRHGPMVLAVCLRVLRHTQDAEDAFQATFLVLAYKATAISPRSKLAGWLHGVAHKTALKTRQRAVHRLEVEKRVLPRSPDQMPPDVNSDELETLLDSEIAGLPDRYRLPIVLCDLEGRPRAEVASALGCPEGTLSSRLTRGRRVLADRLKRRGVGLSVAGVASIFAERSAALSESLIRATVPVVLSSLVTSTGVGSAASPIVAQLATGVMKSMFLKKLRMAALAAFAVAALVIASLAPEKSQAALVSKTSPAPAPALDEKALNETLASAEGRLLMNRKVLKDMKCDIDQLDRIMDSLEAGELKALEKTSETIQQLRGNPKADPKKVREEAQEAGAKEFRKAVAGVVADVLIPTQRKRFLEIDLQVRGHEAFTTPIVMKTLEITAKQKEQLELDAKKIEDAIALASPFRAGGAVGGAGPGPAKLAEYAKTVREARAEGMKKALAILTDDQIASWKKLLGEPFTNPISMPANRFGNSIVWAPPANPGK